MFPRRKPNGMLEGNPAVRSRLASVNAMLLNAKDERRLYVAPSCINLLQDLQARHYATGTSELGDEGAGSDLGHMTDALGYVVWRLFPIRIALDRPGGEVIMVRGHERG